VFEGVRALAAGHTPPSSAWSAGAALALTCLLLAGRFFTATYHHAVRTGLIARYSAETVS
jgi:ABC-2 type transport system permease protein